MKQIILIIMFLIFSILSAQEWTNISPFPAVNIGILGNFISSEKGWIFQGSSANGKDIYFTEDGGQNWEIIYSLEDPLEFFTKLSMIDSLHGWATKMWLDNQYPYTSYYSFIKTIDGGYSWEDMSDNFPELNFIYPIYFIDQDIGFFGAGSDTLSFQALIYKTIDGGENWYLTETPLIYFPDPYLVNYSANKFFFIDENNGWVACSAFCGGGLSLFTSDGGENWEVGVEPGLSPDLFDIHFVDLNHGGVAGRSFSSTYVSITEDNFETITYQYDNSNWNQFAYAICFQNNSTIWVTGDPGSINRSTNGGETFEVFQFFDADLNTIQFFDNTGYIFGSQNSLLKFVDPVGINNDFVIQAKDLNIKVYPNPFNPITTISFTIHEESEVELIMYNIKGQKINNLIKQVLIKGDHSISWDGRNNNGEEVSSGLYLCRLRIEDQIISKKLMMMK
jgi:photosystem II stability/assembly factor-like uncharacterized protein